MQEALQLEITQVENGYIVRTFDPSRDMSRIYSSNVWVAKDAVGLADLLKALAFRTRKQIDHSL